MAAHRRQRRTAVGLLALVSTVGALAFAIPGLDGASDAGTVQAADTRVTANSTTIGGTSRYVPIVPVRVLDTRVDPLRRRLQAGESISLSPVTTNVALAAGVDQGSIDAIVVNLTAVDAAGPGFATVWPTGSRRPLASSLNTEYPGHTIPNLVTVPLGVDNVISLYSSTSADFVFDVQGVYVAATESAQGRLVPLRPNRALDTRAGSPLRPGQAITVDLLAAGVPTTASAAVLNVTATRTAGPGFFTVWPGGKRPMASNLNVFSADTTIANQVLVGAHAGAVEAYSSGGGDLIIDVTGYMTGTSDPVRTSGLFVPLAPQRLLDTREPGAPTFGEPVPSGGSVRLPVAGRGGVPASGFLAVSTNTTATRTLARGYVTVWPADSARPSTSSLNFMGADRTIANHVVSRTKNGAISLATLGGTHIVVDVTGYWTDTSLPLPEPTGTKLTVDTIDPPSTTVPPPEPATAGPHAFLYQSEPKSVDKPYGRWDPCSPIVYLVNADRATQDMADQLSLAIAEVEQATALDFVYAGPTSAGLDFQIPAGVDSVLGFSDQSATPQLAGTVIGIGGGSYSVSTGRVGRGFAFADVDNIQSLDKMRATLMHEIGHMVGLDHVDDATQLMYRFSTSNTEFQDGDRLGLWRVGAAQSCFASSAFSDPGQGASASDTLPDDAVVVYDITLDAP